jgi:phosphoribosylamine--glycine ligase
VKILVVGSGGREHALTWALHDSDAVRELCCAPGNAGTAGIATNIDIDAGDTDAVSDHAISAAYDLVVVGPEGPLVDGLSDRLRRAGVSVFGPSAAAAEIEGSKVFAKEFMARHSIPTAAFSVFDERAAAVAHLERAAYPLVVKADGLAAGKGVILASNRDEAIAAADRMLSGEAFGTAGERIVVEEMLRGIEASFFVLTDGDRFVELATAQDYKRAHDGDRGPNTGGMGAYSPSVYMDEATRRQLVEGIVAPTVSGMRAEDRPYRGVLYVGVMLTDEGPKVLEYNARFGDPETQVLVPRLDGDWLELLQACDEGGLEGVVPRWRGEAAVCVVMASGGYPGAYPKGVPIEGIDDAEARGSVTVFHAGTDREDGKTVTSGGRVLGVTALGADLSQARARAYDAVARIRFDGAHHRTDIAGEAARSVRETRP